MLMQRPPRVERPPGLQFGAVALRMTGVSHRVTRVAMPPFDILNARAQHLRDSGHRVISLGQALPFFGPPACAVDAAHHALQSADVNIYSADAGRLSLREALAERLAATLQIDCTPEEFIITAGGNQAFMLALMTLVDPGDEVILPAPYFVNHEMAISAVGAVPVEAPLSESNAFSVRWPEIEPHLTARTKVVVLCNPSNPTGATVDPAEGNRIVRELSRRNVFVLSDETYMHFVHEGTHWSAASPREWRDNVVMVGTFSKSFGMTGWRIGYLLASSAICAEAIKVQDAMVICAPVISQIAAERAIREAWDYPLSHARQLAKRRRVLLGGLVRIGRLQWRQTHGAFFAFVRVDGCADSIALADQILDTMQVVVIPGAAFGRSAEGFIRLSYGSANLDDLQEALTRLGRFFSK